MRVWGQHDVCVIILGVCSLRLIAPVIKDHGIDYERGKLRDKLNDGTLTLKRTEVCVRFEWTKQCNI